VHHRLHHCPRLTTILCSARAPILYSLRLFLGARYVLPSCEHYSRELTLSRFAVRDTGWDGRDMVKDGGGRPIGLSRFTLNQG
jgi:hypothetical protein